MRAQGSLSFVARTQCDGENVAMLKVYERPPELVDAVRSALEVDAPRAARRALCRAPVSA
jgi:hypothetical protein